MASWLGGGSALLPQLPLSEPGGWQALPYSSLAISQMQLMQEPWDLLRLASTLLEAAPRSHRQEPTALRQAGSQTTIWSEIALWRSTTRPLSHSQTAVHHQQGYRPLGVRHVAGRPAKNWAPLRGMCFTRCPYPQVDP